MSLSSADSDSCSRMSTMTPRHIRLPFFPQATVTVLPTAAVPRSSGTTALAGTSWVNPSYRAELLPSHLTRKRRTSRVGLDSRSDAIVAMLKFEMDLRKKWHTYLYAHYCVVVYLHSFSLKPAATVFERADRLLRYMKGQISLAGHT